MQRPNLLFLVTDQQRADTLGCYNSALPPAGIETPNLDSIVATGTLFERAYVTQPVCTPSRSALLTGLYPHANGCTSNNIPLPAETRTLAEHVAPEYRRAYMGKWHLGDETRAQHGFDTWVSIDDHYDEDRLSHRSDVDLSSYHHFLVANGHTPDQEKHGTRVFARRTAAKLPEPYSKAAFLGREAARFIRDCAAGETPFVLYVSFQEPHGPNYSPFDNLYDPARLPVGPEFRRRPSEQAALLNRVLAEYYTHAAEIYDVDMTTEVGWRKHRAIYHGQVTLVDRAVGEILAALDEAGQRDNTVVVFTSDHGDMMGDHNIFRKGILYEESVRVPLLVRVPWLSQSPHRVATPVSHIDLVPTLLDLLGSPTPTGLHGRSRASILAGDSAWHEDDVVVEWNGDDGRKPTKSLRVDGALPDLPWDRIRGPWRSLVSPDGFKLNLAAHDQCELYDLNADPYEATNLFDDPRHQGRIGQMAARVRQWQMQTNDSVAVPGLSLDAPAPEFPFGEA